MQGNELTVSVPEAARMLGIGRNSTYNLVRQGRLRSIRVGRRVMIPRHEVKAFLERETRGHER